MYRCLRSVRRCSCFPTAEFGILSPYLGSLPRQALLTLSPLEIVDGGVSGLVSVCPETATISQKEVTMPQSENHHRIDYIEFPATSTAPVKNFYTTVFGWKFDDYGPGYAAFHDGRLAGGFDAEAAKPATGPSALAVIYSSNLEATEKAVRAAGAIITRPIFDFPGGRRFHFADPSGNELAVWSDAS